MPNRPRHGDHWTLAQAMQAYVGGDSSAFGVLYRRLARPVRKYVTSLVGPDVVDDVVQRVFLNVHRFRNTYSPAPYAEDRAMANWVFAIARNEARNVLRKWARADDHTRRLSTCPTDEEIGLDPQQRMIDAELRALQRRAVRRAIEMLPPAQREVLELRTLHGMGLSQISKHLGLRRGTVRVRVHRAHRNLADQLRSHSLL